MTDTATLHASIVEVAPDCRLSVTIDGARGQVDRVEGVNIAFRPGDKVAVPSVAVASLRNAGLVL